LEGVWGADHEILLPEEGSLLLFAHATSTLSLLLGCLARTPPTLLASCVALSFDTVFDGPPPGEAALINVLDDVQDTQVMRDASPVALQSVLVKRGVIGKGHRDIEPPIFEGL
jgi:hypothetical protein